MMNATEDALCKMQDMCVGDTVKSTAQHSTAKSTAQHRAVMSRVISPKMMHLSAPDSFTMALVLLVSATLEIEVLGTSPATSSESE